MRAIAGAVLTSLLPICAGVDVGVLADGCERGLEVECRKLSAHLIDNHHLVQFIKSVLGPLDSRRMTDDRIEKVILSIEDNEGIEKIKSLNCIRSHKFGRLRAIPYGNWAVHMMQRVLEKDGIAASHPGLRICNFMNTLPKIGSEDMHVLDFIRRTIQSTVTAPTESKDTAYTTYYRVDSVLYRWRRPVH